MGARTNELRAVAKSAKLLHKATVDLLAGINAVAIHLTDQRAIEELRQLHREGKEAPSTGFSYLPSF